VQASSVSMSLRAVAWVKRAQLDCGNLQPACLGKLWREEMHIGAVITGVVILGACSDMRALRCHVVCLRGSGAPTAQSTRTASGRWRRGRQYISATAKPRCLGFKTAACCWCSGALVQQRHYTKATRAVPNARATCNRLSHDMARPWHAIVRACTKPGAGKTGGGPARGVAQSRRQGSASCENIQVLPVQSDSCVKLQEQRLFKSRVAEAKLQAVRWRRRACKRVRGWRARGLAGGRRFRGSPPAV
jgi:hypothetical protein